jgi:hypothetical protein
VIQETVDRLKVLYVSGGAVPQSDIDDITAKVRFVMGDACQVDWERVTAIPRTPQGKFTFTRSRLVC